jgi:predicted nucleic acid-binding protein
MLLDTSGLLSFLHKAEVHHAESVRLITAAPFRLTHSYVLAELVALAQARGLPRTPVLDFLTDLIDDRAIEVVFVDRALHLAAVDLLRGRSDKTWSLCDSVSFVLMAERGLTEALTTDRHFEQAGFVRLLRS